MVNCDQTSEVHAYHDGELPAERREALEAHLRQCAACRELLGELRRLSALLVHAPLPAPRGASGWNTHEAWRSAGERSIRRMAGWLTAAAATVLLAAWVGWPAPGGEPAYAGGLWEVAAVMPLSDPQGETDAEMAQLAAWFAQDLSDDEARRRP
jgi:anti-sigma factor RsiW